VQVILTDDELLDFDSSNMPKYEPANSERALSVHGDAFRYQLVAAMSITGLGRTAMSLTRARKGYSWLLLGDLPLSDQLTEVIPNCLEC
jgi:hypothetical protein